MEGLPSSLLLELIMKLWNMLRNSSMAAECVLDVAWILLKLKSTSFFHDSRAAQRDKSLLSFTCAFRII